MKAFFPVVGWSWVVFCVILDIRIYKKSRSWCVRSIPAVVKLFLAGLLVLIHFLLPDPPMLEPDVPTLPAFAILVGIGVLIDIWAWFFSDGFPSKRKRWIYACGVGICILLGVFGILFTEGNSYRVTSSGGFRHYTFDAYTGEISKTLKVSDDGVDYRFTFDAEEGTLELLLRDGYGHILYSGTPDDPSEFTVTARGTLEINITTEAFTGILHADRIDSDDP